MIFEAIFHACWAIPVTLICVLLAAVTICGAWFNEDDHD